MTFPAVIGRAALLTLVPLALGAGDDPLAGRGAGQAVDCLDIDRVQGPDFSGGRTILYRQNTSRIWRTEPLGRCTSMRPGDGLIVEVQGRRLCRNDRFRVRSGGYVNPAVCRFGRFVPYDKPR